MESSAIERSTPEFSASSFSDVLAAFEWSLEKPLIPGELRAWLGEVKTSGDAAFQCVETEVQPRHLQLLKEIRGQDIELASRVSDLLEKSQQLATNAKTLKATLDQLWNKIQSEPQQLKLPNQEQVDQLIRAGLDWIIGMRRQEAAVSTWYQESLHRDRGRAD